MTLSAHTTLWPAAVLAVWAGAAGSWGCGSLSATSRAQALARQHREVEAVALLRGTLRAHPGDVAARRMLVRLLGLSGDLPGARAESKELSALLGPGDPTSHLELGHALELSHLYDEALEEYDDAANEAPTSPAGPREGGLRAARWGEVEQARPRLEEAVRRGASDAETWHALGLVRLHLGDLDGAEAAYRAGAAADSASADSWLGLATLAITRNDAQGALDAYDQVAARRPHFAPAQLGRAWALMKLGRNVEASRALDRAADLGALEVNIARLRAQLESKANGR